MRVAFDVILAAAAEPSVWQQLERVPKQTWINIGICIVAIVVLVKVWGALKRFNDYAPFFAVAVAGALIFFYWVYERSEPRFLSPVVDRIAPFFPSRGKQQENIDRARHRDP